jgi:hypothetical protein
MGRRHSDLWIVIHPLPCDQEFDLVPYDSAPLLTPATPATPELLTQKA